MKCRFPAEAWPATPDRKPCSDRSAWKSLAASAMRSGGTHTSSMMSAACGGCRGLVDPREVQPRHGRPRRDRHGLEHGFGDEGERALRADEQPPEDLQRLVGVEEGAQPVAGGVLDLELATDPLGEGLVGADLVADLLEAPHQVGLAAGALLPARP